MTIFKVTEMFTGTDRTLGNFKTLDGAYKYLTKNVTEVLPNLKHWGNGLYSITVGGQKYSVTEEPLYE